MAIMEQNIGTLTSFSGATNLAQLPHGRATMVGWLNWSGAEYPNAKLEFSVPFRSSGTSPVDGGSIGLYLMSSLDGSTWSSGVTPHQKLTGSAYVSEAKLSQMKLIRSLSVNNSFKDTTAVWIINDLAAEGDPKIGDMPEYWGLVIDNKSGCTFPAFSYTVKYQTVSYEA